MFHPKMSQDFEIEHNVKGSSQTVNGKTKMTFAEDPLFDQLRKRRAKLKGETMAKKSALYDPSLLGMIEHEKMSREMCNAFNNRRQQELRKLKIRQALEQKNRG